MDEVLNDDRFAHVAKDPRFRHMRRKDRKVKIDKRFQSMFEDKSFKLKYTVDKRGRPIQSSTNDHLKKYYDLSNSESGDSESASEDEVKAPKQKISEKKKASKTRTLSKVSPSKGDDRKAKKESKLKKKLNIDNEHMSDYSDEEIKDSKVKANIHKSSSSLTSCQKDISRNIKGIKQKLKQSYETLKTTKETKTEKNDVTSTAQGSASSSEITSDSEGSTSETSYVGENVDQAASDGSDSSEEDATKAEEEEGSSDDSEESEEDAGQVPDLARGKGNVASSSDDESGESEAEEGDFDHKWGELDDDALPAEEVTKRLAVCNMDWDRVKAQDMMVLLNSFKPPGGVIHTISIYPSEFGLKRMAEENLTGPPELVEKKSRTGKDQSTEGEDYHREKLRQYQLNRLKYYYAVIECDSANTANHIYGECDGIEYESSSTKIDLRFIPDDMTFDQEPKSVATDMPDASTYKPSLFVNTALNQSKVDLTWDETDRDRIALTMRPIGKDELEALDVKDYLASSSSDEDDPYGGLVEAPDFGTVKEKELTEEEQIQQYKQLLSGLHEEEDKKEENDMELEITWEPGLKENTEELVKKSGKKEGLTPWEQYLEKKKEKKKMKKKEKAKESVKEDQGKEEDDKGEISDDDIPSDVDLNDPYFAEELQKDETKETKKKRKNKKKKGVLTAEEEEEKKRREAELELLMMDQDDDGKEHFSLKAILDKEKAGSKKKKKKKLNKEIGETAEETFQLDVDDTRFADVYNNAMYNIDPSAPEYKATKGTQSFITEKLKRKGKKNKLKESASLSEKTISHGPSAKKAKVDDMRAADTTLTAHVKDTSLTSLVMSVKAKTKSYQAKKNK